MDCMNPIRSGNFPRSTRATAEENTAKVAYCLSLMLSSQDLHCYPRRRLSDATVDTKNRNIDCYQL